jgi:phosphoglycerate dehydrogenase-like enzyme
VPESPIIVVQGADGADRVPRLGEVAGEMELRFATTTKELQRALDGADVLLGWDFRAGALRDAWSHAVALRWIHWSGAGVDAALFPELVSSDVTLTNSRGVFERAMAEYVLGLILGLAKDLPRTVVSQTRRVWDYRVAENIEGRSVLVVGFGSIGRSIGRLLAGAGMEVSAVGRREIPNDPEFGIVHDNSHLSALLSGADYVVNVLPLTRETNRIFGAEEFEIMKPTARFLNVGRGATVDEAALAAAVESGEISGAALDVFETEPLPTDSPLWTLPGVIVSPHMAGDYLDFHADLAAVFLDNLERYRSGRPLLNVVDKELGYVPWAPSAEAPLDG